MKQHFVASGLVFYSDKILLVKHPESDQWIYPGGHIEKDESPEQCLIREVNEETNYHVEIVSNKAFSYFDERAFTMHQPFCILKELVEEGIPHSHIDFVYFCKLKTSLDQINPTKNVGWYSYDEAIILPTFTNFRILMRKAFQYYYENRSLFDL